MSNSKNSALIEAILFLESDPIEIKKISKITNLSEEEVGLALEDLKDSYENVDRGIELITLADKYLLIPKEEHWDVLKDKYGKKHDARLSRAALETLSIIAYKQRITKSEIEKIRGVAADSMIKLLLSKELIKEAGRKNIPGKPIIYSTTNKFLKIFKISSISDLPELDENDLNKFELN